MTNKSINNSEAIKILAQVILELINKSAHVSIGDSSEDIICNGVNIDWDIVTKLKELANG